MFLILRVEENIKLKSHKNLKTIKLSSLKFLLVLIKRLQYSESTCSVEVERCLEIEMSSILKYYQPIHRTLPNPSCHLAINIPSRAIAAANAEVGSQAETGSQQRARKKRGHYHKYTSKQRAEIARYAKIHGVSAAKRVFGKKLGVYINECTIRYFKNVYDEEMSRKQASSGSCSPIKELDTMPRGRPLLLGVKLDTMVKQYNYIGNQRSRQDHRHISCHFSRLKGL